MLVTRLLLHKLSEKVSGFKCFYQYNLVLLGELSQSRMTVGFSGLVFRKYSRNLWQKYSNFLKVSSEDCAISHLKHQSIKNMPPFITRF